MSEFSPLRFMREISDVCSNSGYEPQAQKIVYDYIKHKADDIITDSINNLCAVINGKNRDEAGILLAAHIDEIGFTVKYIDDDGLIYLTNGYGADPNKIISEHVRVYNSSGVARGIIGNKYRYRSGNETKGQDTEIDSIWVDIGASSREEAQKFVCVGDPVVVDKGVVPLMNDRIASRSLDDKIGAMAMIKAILDIDPARLDIPVYFLFTAQEESGFRGIKTFMSRGIKLKAGISVDVGDSMDIPGCIKTKSGDVKLGKGPIITRGPNTNPRLFGIIEKSAREADIPYQLRAYAKPSPVDANVIQVSGDIAAAQIDIPLRYMHHQSEVGSIIDLDNTARLITSLLYNLKKEDSFLLMV